MENLPQTVSEVFPAPSSEGEVVATLADYPPLTMEEDTFALAMIECNGNVPKAYRLAFGEECRTPTAKGRELLNKPAIALRIRDISEAIHEATLITLGTHLIELADIRDQAKLAGQFKVALTAERSRGEVTGLYNKFQHGDGKASPVAIQINMVSPHDVSI